jgi:hypothetical protein
MGDCRFKKRYLVATIAIAMVFLFIIFPQAFMPGKLAPAPEEQELVISKSDAVKCISKYALQEIQQ